MISKRLGFAISVSALLLLGCGAPGSASSAVAGAAETAMVQAPADKKATAKAIESKIIYTGDLELVCDNLDTATSKLEAQVKAANAYIGDATRSTETGQIRVATWTVRVPSANFSSFLKALGGVGDVKSSSVKADDVSQEYYDAQSHLKNKDVEEARLLELLKKDTGDLKDVLVVEKELSRVRGEIEEIQGRLRLLDNQTAYSTLTVKLEEIADFSPASPNLKTEVGRTFMGSWISLEIFLKTILLIVVALIPWLIPLGLVGLLIRWAVRKFSKKSPTPLSPPPVNPAPGEIEKGGSEGDSGKV